MDGSDIFKHFGGSGGKADTPTIDIGDVPHRVSEYAANLISRHGWLYWYRDKLVAFDDYSGEFTEMTAYKFMDWLPQRAWVYRKVVANSTEDHVDAGISDKLARFLLGSYQFELKIPVIDRVLHARMPVRDDDGKIVLLNEGYNAEHQVMVLRDSIPFKTDIPLQEAKDALVHLFYDFPFQDARSFQVQLCAMLNTFLMYTFEKGTSMPIHIWNANMAGSGKSLCAKIALMTAHGSADSTKLTEGQTFANELDSIAKSQRPYLFLDDTSGTINNNYLNAFVTSPDWAFRVFHTQNQASVPLRCGTFITGNNLHCTPDIERRALWVHFRSEKKASQRAAERTSEELDLAWLRNRQNRGNILGWLWAIVREWQEAPSKPSRTLPGFSEYSRTVASMVEFVFGANPLRTPVEVHNAGDTYEQEWRALMAAAVEHRRRGEVPFGAEFEPYHCPTPEDPNHVRMVHYQFTIPELIGVARRYSLYTDVVQDIDTIVEELRSRRLLPPPEEGEGPEATRERERDAAWNYTNMGISKTFGNRLSSMLDQRFPITDVDGKEIEFKFLKVKRSNVEYDIISSGLSQ